MALGSSGRKIVVEFIGDSSSLRANAKSGEAALTGFSGKAQAAGKIAGKALAGGLLLAGAAAVGATKAAAEDEAAQSKLAQQLKQAAGATDKQVAATEDWISKQSLATGVADDELRPALAKLATATGDVEEAQKLAALAMDISAGSGKSLDSVTTALAKAQTGSVAGLSKLGITTKDSVKDQAALESANIRVTEATQDYNDAVKEFGVHSKEAKLASSKLEYAQTKLGEAQGKTKSATIDADEAVSRLAEKYSGSAAKAADTTAGKTKIMQVQFGELQEQIGAKLLPVMMKLAEVGLKVVNWISNNTTTVGVLIGVLGSLLAITTAVGYATKVWGALTALSSIAVGVHAAITGTDTAALEGNRAALVAHAAISKVAAAGQWLLNAALTANPIGLVVVAIAALVAGLILAYKHSETFRNIVNAAFGAVAKAAGFAVDFIRDHWKLILAILTGPIGIAVGLIAGHWDKIKAGAQAVIGWVQQNWPPIKERILAPFQAAKQAVDNVWENFKTGFGVVRDKIVSIAGDIRDKVGAAFDALKAPIQAVIDKVQWLIDKIGDLIAKAGKIHLPNIPGLKVAAGGGKGKGKGGGNSSALTHSALEAGGAPVVVAPRGSTPAGPSPINIVLNLQSLDPRGAGKVVVDALREYERTTNRQMLVSRP